MKFSVVVPTFNRARRGLAECLDALTQQEFEDYEVILSDDGSTDATRDVASRYGRIAYIHGENRGPATARNRGIRAATGDVIAFTDDDCRAPRNWLAQLADGYRRHPEVVGAGGYLDPPDDAVRRSVFARYERFVSFKLYGQGAHEMVAGLEHYPGGGTSNMSYRKSVLDAVGGFDESFPYAAAEDHDLRVRVQSQGQLLLHLPLRVEHLRAYSWASFRRQSITHGRGVYCWEMKSLGRPTGRSRIALRLAKRMLRYPVDVVRFGDPRLATVHLLGNILDTYGQWLECSRLNSQ